MNLMIFSMKIGMKELAFSRNLWISHTVLYGAFSALFSTSRIQPCGRRPVCMQPCSLPQSANQQSNCASNRSTHSPYTIRSHQHRYSFAVGDPSTSSMAAEQTPYSAYRLRH